MTWKKGIFRYSLLQHSKNVSIDWEKNIKRENIISPPTSIEEKHPLFPRGEIWEEIKYDTKSDIYYPMKTRTVFIVETLQFDLLFRNHPFSFFNSFLSSLSSCFNLFCSMTAAIVRNTSKHAKYNNKIQTRH